MAGGTKQRRFQTWNRYAYVANNPLSNVDPLGLDDSTTTCDSSGHCTNVTNVDVTASAPSWFWLAFEGWPGTGSSQTLFCMMFGGCGGSGLSSGGGGGQAQPPAQPQPKPQPKPCGTTGLHGGIGVSYGGSIDAGAMTAGFTSTGSAGWGLFLDQSSTVSNGGFAGGGTAAYFGPLSVGAPTQQGQPFSTGLFAGAGPNVFITNARSVQQLKGPFTTWSINAGGGPVRGSLQLSYGGGVWQFSLGLPIPYTAAASPSISVTKVTTKTYVTSSGCGG